MILALGLRWVRGLTGMAVPVAFRGALRAPEVQAHWFPDDGTFPNNEDLPTLVVKEGVREGVDNRAGMFKRLFQRYEWRDTWRNGIFSYHHYHSTAHEVLGGGQGSGPRATGGTRWRGV